MIRLRLGVVLLAASSAACTYGPAEEHVQIAQIVRLGDSFKALAVVRHDVFREATGLSAFPDGGKRRYLKRRAAEYLLDAEGRGFRVLSRQEAPDSLWESFDAHTVGSEGDSVAYVSLTGCPRGGECYPGLQGRELLRISSDGGGRVVDRVPDGASLAGQMAARRPGELSYVRFAVTGDTITARFDEAGPGLALFRLLPDGSLETIDP